MAGPTAVIDLLIRSRGSNKVVRDTAKINKSLGGVNRNLRGLNAAISVVAITRATAALTNQVDQFIKINNQVKLLKDQFSDLAAVQDQVFRISQRTRSSFDATGTLLTRIGRSAERYGASQAQILRAAETIQKTFRISGSTTRESTAAAIQFSQALGKGRLDGDELRSVLEGNLRLSQLIAESFDTSVDNLKALGAEGKLVSNKVLSGILRAAGLIDDEFSQLQKTFGDTKVILDNAFINLFGRLNDELEISNSVFEFGKRLAQNIEDNVPRILASFKLVAAIINRLSLPVNKVFEGFGNGITFVIDGFRLVKTAVENIAEAVANIFEETNLIPSAVTDALSSGPSGIKDLAADWLFATDAFQSFNSVVKDFTYGNIDLETQTLGELITGVFKTIGDEWDETQGRFNTPERLEDAIVRSKEIIEGLKEEIQATKAALDKFEQDNAFEKAFGAEGGFLIQDQIKATQDNLQDLFSKLATLKRDQVQYPDFKPFREQIAAVTTEINNQERILLGYTVALDEITQKAANAGQGVLGTGDSIASVTQEYQRLEAQLRNAQAVVFALESGLTGQAQAAGPLRENTQAISEEVGDLVDGFSELIAKFTEAQINLGEGIVLDLSEFGFDEFLAQFEEDRKKYQKEADLIAEKAEELQQKMKDAGELEDSAPKFSKELVEAISVSQDAFSDFLSSLEEGIDVAAKNFVSTWLNALQEVISSRLAQDFTNFLFGESGEGAERRKEGDSIGGVVGGLLDRFRGTKAKKQDGVDAGTGEGEPGEAPALPGLGQAGKKVIGGVTNAFGDQNSETTELTDSILGLTDSVLLNTDMATLLTQGIQGSTLAQQAFQAVQQTLGLTEQTTSAAETAATTSNTAALVPLPVAITSNTAALVANTTALVAQQATNAIPGLRDGGTFTVGGRSGIDQNLVAFRASRGETVSVAKPGQSMGGSPISITVNNPPGVRSEVRQESDNGRLKLIMEQVIEEKIGRDVQSGRGVAKAFETRYGLRR